MIKLIILEDDEPVFNPEIRMFVPFKTIIERDKGKNTIHVEEFTAYKGDTDGRRKTLATKELAFIYWFADPRSVYWETYKDEKIRTEILKKYLGLPDKWKIDTVIEEAINFYLSEVENDLDVKFLDANTFAATKTIEYLKNIDYEQRDLKGNLLYKPEIVAKTQKESAAVLDTLKVLREKVLKNLTLNRKIRGNGDKPLGRYDN